ncbi:MAG: type II secretion system protein J, partial [Actinomycetes bacterium]
MGNRPERRRSSSGFTLVEILIGVGILSAIMLVVGFVSINGTISVADQNTVRHLDANSASFVSTQFGKDVQAAAELSKDKGAADLKWDGCGADSRRGNKSAAFGDAVVSLVESRPLSSDQKPIVTYWTKQIGNTFDLTRVRCTSGLNDAEPVHVQLVEGLNEPPEVWCDGERNCPGLARPNRITLKV